MLITFIHISNWFWHRCSMEDEVYKPNTVRRKPWFRAVPHRCRVLHLCLKLLFHFVSLQKSQAWCSNWEHLCLGPTWTLLWPECGLLDSLLKRNKKTFFSLEFWNLGLKLWIHTLVSLQAQAYANCGTACLCYSRTWVIRQMLLKIGWRLKPCSFLFKSQGNFLMLVMQYLGTRVNYQFNTILLYSKLKTETGQHLQLN